MKVVSYVTEEKKRISALWTGPAALKGVIYQFEVPDENSQKKIYIGCTEDTFKKCWYNHASLAGGVFSRFGQDGGWDVSAVIIKAGIVTGVCPAYHNDSKTLMASNILTCSRRPHC